MGTNLQPYAISHQWIIGPSTLSRNSDSFRDNAMQRSEIGVFLPRDAMHDGLRQKICIYTTLCD